MSENKMRILVISDSHGRNDDVAGVIEQVGPIDMLIHCGDVERGDDYIRSLVDCPVHMVSGNNDYNLDLPAQDIFNIGDYKVLVCPRTYFLCVPWCRAIKTVCTSESYRYRYVWAYP